MPNINIGKRIGPRRILLYGDEGAGKSTFGAMSDKPIFIPTEAGLDDIDCQSFDLCATLAAFLDCVAWLYTERHDYLTVVVDSLDWLETLIHQQVCADKGASSLEEIPYGKGPGFALPYWAQVRAGLEALQRDRGMAVILIAHSDIVKVCNPGGDPYHQSRPKLRDEASEMWREWCTEVLYATYEVFTTSRDAGFGRTEVKAVGDGARVMYTTHRPGHVAKNRLGLPDKLPFDWREYAKHLPGNGVAAEPA